MDEAGNTGRNLRDPNQPTHLILTIAIEESRIRLVHDRMREIARRRCPDDCDHAAFEFHGHALFAGSGPFAPMTPAERIEIYDEILETIAIAGAHVVVRGVHKPRLADRYQAPYHPHDICLMFTIETVERLAQELDCRVLLVADEAREIEDAALRDLASYQETGTSWGFRTERIERIVDTIHFVRSETNLAIQLADCATFIAARQRKIDSGQVKPNEAVTRLWTERIVPRLHFDGVWYPSR